MTDILPFIEFKEFVHVSETAIAAEAMRLASVHSSALLQPEMMRRGTAVVLAALGSNCPDGVASFFGAEALLCPDTALVLLKTVRNACFSVSGISPSLASSLHAFFDAVEVTVARRWTSSETCTMFRGLFETSPHGAAIICSEGNIFRVNREFERLTGRSAGSLGGLGLSELFHGDGYERFQAAAALLAAGTVPSCMMESRILCEGTKPRWVQLALSPLDARGAVVMQVQDISDAKSTEEALCLAIDDATMEKAKVDAMIAAIGDGVSIQDTDFVITYQNDALRRITGECVGRRCHEVYAGRNEVCEGCPLLEALDAGRPCIARVCEMIMAGGASVEITTSAMLDDKGAVIGSVKVVRDVTARKKMEDALKGLALGVSTADGSSFYLDLVRALSTALAADACFIATDSGGFLETLAVWRDGAPGPDFRHATEGTPFQPELLPGLACYPGNLAKDFPADPFIAAMGAEACIAMPMLDSRNRRIGVVGLFFRRGIERSRYPESLVPVFAARAAGEIERMRTRRAFLESEKRYRSLFESAMEGIFRSTGDGRFIDANPALALMLGYDTTDELLSVDLARAVYADPEERTGLLKLLEENGSIEAYPARFRRKNGETITVSIFARASFSSTGEQLIEGIILDVTDKMLTEEKILRSLREKEVLLQEIHHRVKNNLQIVSGLLALQSMQIKNSKAKEILLESENRIASMAMIHDRLYNSRDLLAVDFAEYARNLVNHILSSHSVAPTRVSVQVDVADVQLSVEQAIPCGLIINELVMNSLRHGFRRHAGGTIWVSLAPADDDFVLRVADDGRGFETLPDFATVESLGLRLVSILAGQLDGSVSCTSARLTEISVRFPKTDSHAVSAMEN